MPGLGLSCWNKPAPPGEQKGNGQIGHHGVGSWVGWGSWGGHSASGLNASFMLLLAGLW